MKLKIMDSFSKIYENTNRIFHGVYKDYNIQIVFKYGRTYYIQCEHPSGNVVCNGIYDGSFGQIMNEVIEQVEYCIKVDNEESEDD